MSASLFTWDGLVHLLLVGLRIAFIIGLAIFATALMNRWAGTLRQRAVRFMAARNGKEDGELEKRAHTLVGLGVTSTAVLTWIVATFMVMKEAGFDITPLLAGAGVAGLAIGFGAQSLVKDVITGALMLLENQIRVGDVAILNGTGGLVESMNLRTVVLRGIDGTVHVFPNGTISSISNMTKDFSFYVFNIGVAYKEDTDRVSGVLQSIADEMMEEPEWKPLIMEPLEVSGVDSFGDSAVVIRARIKTRPIKQWAVGREMNRRIKMRFDKEGIEIPFPHLSLYFGEASKPITVDGLPNGGAVRGGDVRGAVREALEELGFSPELHSQASGDRQAKG